MESVVGIDHVTTSLTGRNTAASANASAEVCVDQLPRPGGDDNYVTIRVLRSRKRKRRKTTSSTSTSASSHRPTGSNDSGIRVKVIVIDAKSTLPETTAIDRLEDIYRQEIDAKVAAGVVASGCVRGENDDAKLEKPPLGKHTDSTLKPGFASISSAKKKLAWVRYRKRQRQVLSCLRRTFAFLLSTVGLSICMIFYTIVGGFVFAALEAPYERRIKSGVQDSRDWHVERLWNITESLNVLHQQNWTRLAESILDNYTRRVFVATKIDGWDGKDFGGAVGGRDRSEEEEENGEVDLQWNFAGSMLYAVTVVTTIGKICSKIIIMPSTVRS